MKVIYNSKMVEESNLPFSWNNRAMLYGDGLFETIIYKNGEIKYLSLHLNRLAEGMKAIGLIEDNSLEEMDIREQIEILISQNGLEKKNCRIKLLAWRKPGGLFTPKDNHSEILITVSEQPERSVKPVEAQVAEKVRLFPTPYSQFKTCNMLPYVIAGKEKEARKSAELVILSHDGNIAECSSSNIFWIKNGAYYTPSLETGCIGGVMRRAVIEKLKENRIEISEVKEGINALEEADVIFCTNVSGLIPFSKFLEKELKIQEIPKLLVGL